jgi:anti-anti-sigma factor
MLDSSRSQFRISSRLVDGITIVAPHGEIDLAVREEFREHLRACDGVAVVDLAATTFVDSSAIGVLVAQRNRLGTDGSLTVAKANAHIAHVLTLVGLHELLTDGSSRAAVAAPPEQPLTVGG